MSYETSDIAKKILALLGNAKELATYHQQRTFARDVTKACKIFAKTNHFPVDPEIFDQLILAIPGKMNFDLSELFATASEIVLAMDIEIFKKSKRKEKPLPMWEDIV